VNFLNGSSQLGSATLNASGVATYAGTLSPGINTVTAMYSGDTTFAASTSPALTVSEPDYSVTASPTTLTVSAGSNSSVTLTVTPVGGYNGTVAMSCATQLAGVTCSFNPASYSPNGSNNVLTGTIEVAASSSATATEPAFKGRGKDALAAMFWLPGSIAVLLIAIKRRRLTASSRQIFQLLALLTVASISACGGGSSGGSGGGGRGAQPVTGAVIITAAGSEASVSQTLQLTVTVE
jgi:hypothetical protein